MIAVLGAMLGTTFTPERLEGALSWLPSLGPCRCTWSWSAA